MRGLHYQKEPYGQVKLFRCIYGAVYSVLAHEKILPYLDKVNTFLSIGKTLVVVELDLTNRCNNRCPACVGRNTVKAELS